MKQTDTCFLGLFATGNFSRYRRLFSCCPIFSCSPRKESFLASLGPNKTSLDKVNEKEARDGLINCPRAIFGASGVILLFQSFFSSRASAPESQIRPVRYQYLSLMQLTWILNSIYLFCNHMKWKCFCLNLLKILSNMILICFLMSN